MLASFRSVRIGTLLVVVVAVLVGCGDNRPSRVPVSGQVLIDGKPLPYGLIRMITHDARPASGRVGPDGRFQLTCFGDHDGAVPGAYKITVSGAETLGPRSQRWHAPKKYANVSTSGLAATIDGPTDSLLVELTWGGKGPFVEYFASGE